LDYYVREFTRTGIEPANNCYAALDKGWENTSFLDGEIVQQPALFFADWGLSYLPLNNLRVQWGAVGGPGAIEGTIKQGGRVIFMPLQNAHAISGNGRRFDDSSLMLMRPGGEFCFSAINYNRWLSVFVPDEFLTGSNAAVPAIIGASCNLVRIPASPRA
jgi:hypothetical protein